MRCTPAKYTSVVFRVKILVSFAWHRPFIRLPCLAKSGMRCWPGGRETNGQSFGFQLLVDRH
jgi:hypothetical protein